MRAMVRSATAAATLFAGEAAAQSAAPSTASGLGQTLFALVVVIGTVFALAWLARRTGLPGRGASPLLHTVASHSVGARERVVIVETGDSWLVLGVTAHNVSLLQTQPKGQLPETAQAPLAGGFAALLNQAKGRHGKR
jgi:flagellar protein FliO/FliZ